MTVLEIEKALVRKVQRKDPAAFEKLWLMNLSYLRNFLRGRLVNPDLIQDVEQRTALQVWLKIKQFRNDKPFHYWLFSVAKNEHLMMLRKSAQHETREVPLADIKPGEWEVVTSWQPRIAERLDAERELVKIQLRAARLTPIQQRAFYAKFILGMFEGEAKRYLGVTEATYKSRIYRARQFMFKRAVNA